MTNKHLKGNHSILILGTVASFSYATWAIFDDLSNPQHIFIANLFVYGTAFLLSLLGLKHKRGPSLAAIISGFCGGAINVLVLYALIYHNLTVVYPFVSFGAVIYMGISFFFLRGSFSTEKPRLFAFGIAVTFLGLLLCGIGLSGGFANVNWNQFTATSVSIAFLISLSTGLWIFFAFYTITKQNYEPLAATTWVFLGSFSLAIILLFTDLKEIVNYEISIRTLYAIIAGFGMFVGELATYFAFKFNPSDQQRIEQTLIVFLANSELVPIVLFSALLLNEYCIEGLLGSFFVLCGILSIKSSSNL